MKIFLSLVFFLLLLQCAAQQYNNWYFGKAAGISFNTGQSTIPYVLTDGVNNFIPPPFLGTISTSGGPNASISDSSGNLLFYTNGVTVYNRTHLPMLNGNNLMGHPEANQAVLIAPMPGNDSLYYVFTTDAIIDTVDNGYRYSIVNMKHDGGNGEVVTKNVLLNLNCSNRLAAVRHANGIDVWIIGNKRNSNVFWAWLLTCTGLQTSPVISTIGRDLNEDYDNGSHGYMKISPDGNLLCQTNGYNKPPGNFFQLFDFDNATGKLSNAREISSPGAYWSCEFSPDSKLLYLTNNRDLFPYIDQFEAKLGSASAIIASRVSIPAAPFGSIQSGPDGKIYLDRGSSKLSVISRPNVKGLGCTFELDKINLNKTGGSLPSMINDGPYDPYNYFTSLQIDSCKGIVQFNGQTAMKGTVQWLWDFEDGASSTLQNPQHTFTAYNQPYNVKLTITSPTGCRKIVRKNIVYPRGTFIKPGFDFVVRCDSGYVRFINSSVILPDTSNKKYSWDFGDGNTSIQKDPVHSYTAAGEYQVKLKMTTATACIADSITRPVDVKQFNIQAPPDQVVDAGQSVQLYVTGGGSVFQWSPTRWLNNPMIANPIATPLDTITYTVTATDDAGCKAGDSVTLFVKNEVKGINVPTAFTPNNDGLNDIFRPLFGSQYTLKEFCIFNQWGQKVYSTTEAGEGWNGMWNNQMQNAGVYVWVLKVSDGQNKTIMKKGTVMLIR